MRRAKKPPSSDHVALASVVVDGLVLGRRTEVGDDLATLVPVAVGEYLRTYPRARNVNSRVWLYNFNASDKEVDYCCFFCRESIVTLPWRKSLTIKLEQKLVEHGEICAMRFLAGQTSGVGPARRP